LKICGILTTNLIKVGVFMTNNNNVSHNYIIERFKKGEISITDAFIQLTSIDNKSTPDIKYNLTDRKNIKKKLNNNIGNELNKLNKEFNKESNRDLKQNQSTENMIECYLNEMEGLVGLKDIKKIIKEYIAFIKVQKLRERYRLKATPVVMHMIFKGNPGTGKTTMARIIGKIFQEIGFLKNGDIIEADRADLVGEYIGHTAQKTKKIIQKALGGVLFIDEAYSLARGGEKDFGKEAIDTMVKAMEDNKDNLIIILAGYRKEMDFFLQTNPGLRSRFAIQIDFPDYSIDQLVEIAELMYKEREYILDKSSKHYIYNVLTKVRNNEDINGNARSVRNLIERSIRQQAKRIINNPKINRNELMKITREDLSVEGLTDGRLSCDRNV